MGGGESGRVRQTRRSDDRRTRSGGSYDEGIRGGTGAGGRGNGRPRVFWGEAFEVEFVPLTGDTVAVLTVAREEVRPVQSRELTHARGIE
jgi:hypothetical protein